MERNSEKEIINVLRYIRDKANEFLEKETNNNSIDISNLTEYIGKKYEVIRECRMFLKGTILEIKSINIDKSGDKLRTRFVCIKTSPNGCIDTAYLDTIDFIYGTGIMYLKYNN